MDGATIDDVVEGIYHKPDESMLVRVVKAPFRGVKELFTDTKKAYDFVKGEVKKPILKYYGTAAAAGLAAIPAREVLRKGVADLTGTAISDFKFFPYPLALGGYEVLESSVYANPLGTLASATLPYVPLVALGIHQMIKGTKEKNLYRVAAGSAFAGSPLIGVIGDMAIASKSVLMAYAPSIASVPLAPIGLAALMVGATYKMGKGIARYLSSYKPQLQSHAAPAQA